MDSVWTVTTKYDNGCETLNCICETEDKAKKEKKMLETMAEENKEYIESTCGKISSIDITEWGVL